MHSAAQLAVSAVPARPASSAIPARPASSAVPARPASSAIPARPAVSITSGLLAGSTIPGLVAVSIIHGLLPGTVAAATLTVSTSPDPGEYASIQEAIRVAQPADTIRIEPGRYLERLVLNGKPLTLEGTGAPDQVVIDARRAGSVVTLSPASGLTTLRRLTLTGGEADQGGGIHARQADLTLEQVRLVDNVAKHLGGGAWIDGGRIQLLDSEVVTNRAGSSGGVYLARSVQVSILRTAFVRNRGMMGAGLHLQNAGGLISGCLFLENGRTEAGEGVTGEMSIYLQEGNGAATRVVNNTFVRSGCCNIAVRATVGIEVANNIFESGAGYGIYVHQKGKPTPDADKAVKLQYNNLHENASGDYKFVDQAGTPYELGVTGKNGNIAAPPEFVDDLPYGDWTGGDYRLGAGSASIDAGDPASSRSDRDGTRNDQGMFGGPYAPGE